MAYNGHYSFYEADAQIRAWLTDIATGIDLMAVIL